MLVVHQNQTCHTLTLRGTMAGGLAENKNISWASVNDFFFNLPAGLEVPEEGGFVVVRKPNSPALHSGLEKESVGLCIWSRSAETSL